MLASTVGRPTHSLVALRTLRGGADNLLTVSDVAARLSLSTATVYRMTERGDFPHVRVLNAIRVAPEDLVTFVASQRKGGR